MPGPRIKVGYAALGVLDSCRRGNDSEGGDAQQAPSLNNLIKSLTFLDQSKFRTRDGFERFTPLF